MKKLLSLIVLSALAFVGKTQVTGYTHYASTANKLINEILENDTLLVSSNYTQYGQSEKYLIKFNLKNQTFVYANDSVDRFITQKTKYAGNTAIGILTTDTLVYTTDKWATYNKIPASYFSAISFEKTLKTSTGFIIVTKSPTAAEVYYSADGINWNTTPSVSGTLNTTNVFNNYVEEVQGKTYFIQNLSFLAFKSNDGGQTFTSMSPSGAAGNLNKIHIIDSVNMIAYRNSSPYYNVDFYLSTNGGGAWQTMNITASGFNNLYYVKSLDSLYFYRGGTDSLFLSQDTGVTYSFHSTNLPDNFTYYAQVYGPRTQYIFDNQSFGAALHYTKHIDSAWQFIGTPNFGGAVIDFKGDVGFIGTGNFAFTTDGAKTFDNRKPSTPASSGMKAAKVLDDTTFLFSDSEGDIFKTTNQGDTWVKKLNVTGYFPIPNRFYQVNNSDTLILTHYDVRAKYSTDKGETWQNATAGGGAFEFCVTPSGNVFQAASNQFHYDSLKVKIYNNTNITASPTQVHTLTGDSLKVIDIEMANENKGYVLTSHARTKQIYLHSTNDAWNTSTAKGQVLNLNSQYGNFNLSFLQDFKYRIHAFGQDTIYLNKYSLVDEDSNSNNLYYSYDGGTTWNTSTVKYTKQNQSPNERIYELFFFNSNSFIITTTFGRVFLNKTITASNNGGGGTTSIETIELKNEFNVYPNPTNGLVNIDYDKNIDKLTVYDLSGKMMLQNKNTKQIDVSNLTPGTYLIEVVNQNKPSVKLFVKQ